MRIGILRMYNISNNHKQYCYCAMITFFGVNTESMYMI